MAAVLFNPVNGLLAHLLDALMEASVLLVGSVHRGVDLGTGDLGPAHAAAALLRILHALDGDELVQTRLSSILRDTARTGT